MACRNVYPAEKQLLCWQGTVEFSKKESANNVKYQSNEQEPKQTMNKRWRPTVCPVLVKDI